mmetsp:Transcript_96221/g.269203  ORF Transcript_96221/g.269203 Transcript_96221/m.269203 type:complete len:386 (+) Transcript_96221:2-1159(+)
MNNSHHISITSVAPNPLSAKKSSSVCFLQRTEEAMSTTSALSPAFSPPSRTFRMRRWATFVSVIAFVAVQVQVATASVSHGSPKSPSPLYIRIPGSRYEEEDWDKDHDKGWIGSGREFSVFDSRGGSSRSDGEDDVDEGDGEDFRSKELLDRYRRARLASSRGRYRGAAPGFYGSSSSSNPPFDNKRRPPEFFQTVQTWWSSSVVPNLEKMPKIVCRVEPTTTLKLRKTFRPLKTIIRLGADFNTQLGVWQFQSSWEDAIIGGKLTLAGKELQFTKSWQLSVGAVEDLVTRLRFRAAINLQTYQAYARVGFRTERLSPINVMEGFTILKRLPLDGSRGNVKLEVKANVALPEPELEYSTETQRSLIGNMGDVEVSIDELNLLLDY